jgi:hypothetical protein
MAATFGVTAPANAITVSNNAEVELTNATVADYAFLNRRRLLRPLVNPRAQFRIVFVTSGQKEKNCFLSSIFNVTRGLPL